MARPFLAPFRRLLRLAGSRWRYPTPPPHGFHCSLSRAKCDEYSVHPSPPAQQRVSVPRAPVKILLPLDFSAPTPARRWVPYKTAHRTTLLAWDALHRNRIWRRREYAWPAERPWIAEPAGQTILLFTLAHWKGSLRRDTTSDSQWKKNKDIQQWCLTIFQ
jgi:hypothetical protein